MPSAYAHYRHGQEVFRSLPRDIRETIGQYKELFDVGLHGPDVLFYFDPVARTGVTMIGYRTHHKSGKQVFAAADRVVEAHGSNPMYLAYLYGYLCHFALDSMCHGYVGRRIEESGVGHHEIEMEFDRMLMVTDGLDPLKHRTTDHIIPSMRNAAVMSAFYPGTKPGNLRRAMRRMIACLGLLRGEDPVKRGLVDRSFRLAGKKYKQIKGLLMSREPNPQCEESSRRLLELYKLAVPLGIKLISQFEGTMAGKIPFDTHYGLNFESEEVEEV